MTLAKKCRLFSSFAIAAVLALTLGASGALADTANYSLNDPNAALNGYTGPYATVTIDRTSTTTATFTFTALTNGGHQYLFTDGSAAGANINATTFTQGGATGTDPYGAVTYTRDSNIPSNIDGKGQFNLIYNSGSSSFADGVATVITFTVTNVSGTWASASDVVTTTGNGEGNVLGAHIGACATTTCSAASGFAVTGFAADGTPVPEPTTISLLVALGGLMAFAAVRLRGQAAS